MNIIIDAFGGDNAPLEVIRGAVRAAADFHIDITLVGDDWQIRDCAEKNQLDISALKIVHAESVIDVCEEPTEILKSRKNCSMAVGMQLLADGKGDAFVSAGSTGALVVGTTFIVKRMKGIKRCALATVLPTAGKPVMLMDVGANADCRPEMLMQFGVMGSAYMNKILKVPSPEVKLVNIGAEKSKGRELELTTYALLEKAPVNFRGNIEARELPLGGCDVAVTDGFSGNLLLKLYEGMGKFFSGELKTMLTDGITAKIAAAILLKKIKAFKRRVDYSEYGGAPLLGAAKPVIKAHGSSNAKAFYNAIRQAKQYVETDVGGEISAALKSLRAQKAAEQADSTNSAQVLTQS